MKDIQYSDKILQRIRESYYTRQRERMDAAVDWEENLHPRDKGGKFAKKGAGAGGGASAEQKQEKKPVENKPAAANKGNNVELALPELAEFRQHILDDTEGKMSIDEIINNPFIKKADAAYIESLGEDTDFNGKVVGSNETILIDTPERNEMRKRIAQKINETGSISGKDRNKNPIYEGPVNKGFRAEIVLGPPAGGKSSVIVDRVSSSTGSRVIDSDEIKKDIPEFNGGDGAGLVHKESSDIILEKMVMPEYYKGGSKCGDNIVIPLVGKKPGYARAYAKALKDAGYEVHLSFNDVSDLNSAKRATTRYAETGRFLSPSYIKSVGKGPENSYNILKNEGLFDTYTRYNNNVPYGTPAQKIEHKNNKGEEIPWEDWRK